MERQHPRHRDSTHGPYPRHPSHRRGQGQDRDKDFIQGSLARFRMDLACKEGDAHKVQNLLDKGAEVNYPPGSFEISPLQVALYRTSRKSSQVVDLLLARGAQVDAVDNQGQWILELLEEPFETKCRCRIAELLLHAGASVPRRSDDGRSATWFLIDHLDRYLQRSGNSCTLENCLNWLFNAVVKSGIIPERISQGERHDLLTRNESIKCLLRKMTLAGFDFHCVRYLQEVEVQGQNASPADREMAEFLQTEGSSPPPLTRLCRTTIRSTLARFRPLGCHLHQRMDSLPLPNCLIDFLKMNDIFWP